MSFVNPNLVLGISLVVVLLINCGLLFGVLSSFLINKRKKSYVLIGILTVWIIITLIRSFSLYTTLGMVALIIYIAFSVLTFFVVRHKKKAQ